MIETEPKKCPNCGDVLYVRGLFYLDKLPFAADGYDPGEGDIQESSDLEVYCMACDFSQDMDEYVRTQTKEK
jgi:hypothetical protein